MVCLQTGKGPRGGCEVSTIDWLQRALLAGYRLASWTGFLSTRVGRAGFAIAYDFYKSRWEAPDIAALQPLVRPGSVVIDVGANIGFFTRRFAEWVRPRGLVIAMEPERNNFATLTAMLSQRGLLNVEPIQAVAAECTGSLRLQINPSHPADHRIGASGIEVRAVTLDSLLEERGWPEVSLIKIDVQGAEERVLRGATETLRRCRPALYVEVDDAALRQMGSSSERVLAHLQSAGYEICRVESRRRCAVRTASYTDFLFVPKT